MTPGSWWGPEKQVFHQSQRSSRNELPGVGAHCSPQRGRSVGLAWEGAWGGERQPGLSVAPQWPQQKHPVKLFPGLSTC